MSSTNKLLEGTAELAPPDWTPIATVQDMYGLSSRERTLGDYWRILRKRKWTLIVSLVVVVTAAGLISLRMTPIYDAVTRISISSQAPSNILNFKDHQQYSDPMEDQGLVIATQVNILQSNTLALLVIHNLGLNNRSEFAGKDRPTTGGVPVSGSSPETLGREDQLIGAFHSNLNVLPVPNTAIIEIKYSSPDPRSEEHT